MRTLSESVATYVRHWRAFLVTSCVLLVPVAVVQWLATTSLSGLPSHPTAAKATTFVLLMFSFSALLFSSAALNLLAADLAVGGPGRWDKALWRGLRRGWPLATGWLATALVFVIGLALPLVAVSCVALAAGAPARLADPVLLLRVACVPVIPLMGIIGTIASLEGLGGFKVIGRGRAILRAVSWQQWFALLAVNLLINEGGRVFQRLLPNHLPLAELLTAILWGLVNPVAALAALSVYREARRRTDNAADPELRAQIDVIDAPAPPVGA